MSAPTFRATIRRRSDGEVLQETTITSYSRVLARMALTLDAETSFGLRARDLEITLVEEGK